MRVSSITFRDIRDNTRSSRDDLIAKLEVAPDAGALRKRDNLSAQLFR